MLIDEAKIYVRSGDGGDGVIAFRREKYVPHGGPNGGDGGRGGDVVVRVNPNHNTLSYFKQKSHFKARHGVKGGSTNKTGADADTLYVDVPPGTLVKNADTQEILADLVKKGDEYIVVKGGRGGKGNARFKSASNKAPRIAERGAPGEEMWIVLEMRILADVGLVGVPNAGKSTLLSVLTNAKPKIADYPFTTIQPNLGVLIYDHQDLVLADIPGLIEGAHMGIGLGHTFLKHVQRTRLLIHVINGDSEDPLADYNQINAELALYDESLGDKPQIVIFNKMDLPQAQEKFEDIKKQLDKYDIDVLPVSALTHDNTKILIQNTFQTFQTLPEQEIIPTVEESSTYQLDDNEPIFTISRDDDGSYIVSGPRIERAARMTYWDYEEAVLRFQKILDTLGISEALKEAGVEPGDTVFIGEYELEWTD